MFITMHLRAGSISEADKVIFINYFVKRFQKKRSTCKFIIYCVTSFSLAYISFSEFIARQLKSQMKILKVVLQN